MAGKNRERPGYIMGADGHPDGIFIHIPRTGGKSLCRYLGLQDGHASVAAYGIELGDQALSECYVFSVLRNPWDQYFGYYLSNRGFTGHQDTSRGFRRWVAQGAPRKPTRVSLGGVIAETDPLDQLAYIQSDLYACDVRVDFFPEMQRAADRAAMICGVEPVGEFPAAPHQPDRLGWWAYYDQETFSRVADQRIECIDRFEIPAGAYLSKVLNHDAQDPDEVWATISRTVIDSPGGIEPEVDGLDLSQVSVADLQRAADLPGPADAP